MEKFNTTQIAEIKPLFDKIKYDGHTIWKPSVLKSFPKALRDRFTHIIKSDGSAKGSIWKDGKMVKETKGVYGLSLLRGLADDLGVKYDGNVFGRGTEARNISSAIEALFPTLKD